jgi:hypothetical protein
VRHVVVESIVRSYGARSSSRPPVWRVRARISGLRWRTCVSAPACRWSDCVRLPSLSACAPRANLQPGTLS